jgi:drug/metabolite transporter (DMT)-like permease
VSASTAEARALPGWALWLLAALTLLWGANWPAMKIAVGAMPPLHFRSVCLFVGAAGVFTVAALAGQRLAVRSADWGRLAMLSLFNFFVWNVTSIYGVRLIDSGRASILAYTMPLWAVLLGMWILRERLTPRRALGLALGLAGMLFLLGGELAQAGRSPLGAALMIVAAVGWALGLVLMKRWPVDLPASSLTAWQMLLAAVPVLAGALALEEGTFLPWTLPPREAWAAIYTIVVGYVFCQWAWIKIALVAPVSISSLSSLMIPVVGVFSGMIVLGERPGWNDFAALGLVSLALAVVLLPSHRT